MKIVSVICAAVLLSACAPKVQSIEPDGVTPAELEMRADCVKFLSRNWPVSEPIMYTRISRHPGGEHQVGVNMDMSMNQAQQDEVVAAGANNGGACFYKNGKLTIAFRYSDLKAGQDVQFTQAHAPEFEWF